MGAIIIWPEDPQQLTIRKGLIAINYLTMELKFHLFLNRDNNRYFIQRVPFILCVESLPRTNKSAAGWGRHQILELRIAEVSVEGDAPHTDAIKVIEC